MKKLALLFAVVIALTLGSRSISFSANATSLSINGIGGGPMAGIEVDADSFGSACGIIGGVTVGEDPAGACSGTLNQILPSRIVDVTDAAGNHVDATADKVTFAGFKSWIAVADSIAMTKNVSSFARFVDPLTFSDPQGEPFDVDLVRSFFTSSQGPGLRLDGSGGPGGSASASYHAEMSTDLTGFLFSADFLLSVGQPLSVDVTLGSYVNSLPGWDELALENQLRSLLDAGTPDNNFTLDNFAFPSIPISVGAGQILNVFTADRADTAASPIPEPSTYLLFATGLLGILGYGWRKRKLNT